MASQSKSGTKDAQVRTTIISFLLYNFFTLNSIVIYLFDLMTKGRSH